MSERERGKEGSFAVGRPSGAAAVEPAERTTEQKAKDAETAWGNLKGSIQVVRKGVADMETAFAVGDRAGWAEAKQAAAAGLAQLRKEVKTARGIKSFATDDKVKEGLEGAARALTDAKELVKNAPAEPKARVPVLACADALLAVLPPEHVTGPVEPVMRPAEAAVKNIFENEMALSDMEAFQAIWSERRDLEIARRFGRFDEVRRTRLLAIFKDPKVRAKARAEDEVRNKARGAVDSAHTGSGALASEPPTSAEPTLTSNGAADVSGAGNRPEPTATPVHDIIGQATESTAAEPSHPRGASPPPIEPRGDAIAARVPGVTYEGDGQFRVATGVRHFDVTIQRVRLGAPRLRHGVGEVVTLEIPTGLGEAEFAEAVVEQLQALHTQLSREPVGVRAPPVTAAPAAPVQLAPAAAAISAEDGRVAATAGKPQLAQHGAAMQFYRLHQPAFLAAAQAQLLANSLGPGSPQLAWAHGAARFVEQLGFELTGPESSELPGLLHPSDPWQIIDANRSMDDDPTSAAGAMRWAPAAGFALASAIEHSVRASLARVAARYVAQAGTPTAGELVASHPMDRVVAAALCAGDVVIRRSGAAPARGATSPGGHDVQTEGVRLVTSYAWLGERDPALWNWIRVEEPANATPEEIAVTLWNRTEYAYGLTPIGGYVAIPKEWARQVPGVKIPSGAGGLSTELVERSPAEQLAASRLGDGVALVQGNRASAAAGTDPRAPGFPAPAATSPDRAALLDTLDSSAAILDEMSAQLAAWRLAYALDPGRAFTARQRAALAGAAPADVAMWAPVVAQQRAIIGEAAGGLLEVFQLLQSNGIASAQVQPADRSHPALQVLHGYGAAAGTAQLAETARATLVQARAAHAMLPVMLVAHASSDAGRDVGRLQSGAQGDVEGTRRAGELAEDRAQLASETAALQGQAMAKGAPDPALLETAALDAATLGFRARIANLRLALRSLGQAIDAADQGVIAAIANLSAETRIVLLSGRLDAASAALGGIESILDHSQPAAVNARYDAMPPDAPAREMGRQFELRETRQAQLVRAQQQFAAVAQEHRLEGPLFEQAEQAIHDMAIRKLLATVAVLLAAGVAASGIAAAAGDFAAGLAGGGRTVTTVGEATGAMRTARVVGGVTQATVDAGLNASAQTALNGDQLGSSFVENLLTNAAVRAALQPLHAVIRTWGGLDEQAYALWAQQGAHGKLALAKTATVSADLIASAATAYVVHRLATVARGQTPDEQTLASWALQGATMTLAHVINSRLDGALARLRGAGGRAGELIARMRQQQRLAQHVATVEPVDRGLALQLLVEHQLAIESEIEFWRRVAADPTALHATGLDAAQVEAKLAGAQAQRADTQGQVFDVLALRFAGLSQEVEGGRLWVGDTEQIANALAAIRAAHLDLGVEPPPPQQTGAPPTARIWRVTLRGETVEIRERARVGRVREAVPGSEVGAATATAAQRYGEAAQALRPLIEARTRSAVESTPDFSTDVLQIGHGFGGVMNQDTQHEHAVIGDPHSHLIVYAHDGAMTNRGALPSGQPPELQTMPGVRTGEQTADQASYAKSEHLGRATEIGRLEMQTPAYQGSAVKLEERPSGGAGPASHVDPWTRPDRALRIQVVNAAGKRWIYCNRVDNVGGMGPTNYGPAKAIIGEPGASPTTRQEMFDQLRAAGVLIGGDDPDLSHKLRPGERILVWGGSPTGAWAGEDAAMHGAQPHVVGESQHVHRTADTPANATTAEEFEGQLRQAGQSGDAARVQALLEQRVQATHAGAGLARNRQPGATYGPDAAQRGIHVEIGVPTRMRLLPNGKVEVSTEVGQGAAGVGGEATVRQFDRVVMALGQSPGDPGGPAGLLGPGAQLGRKPPQGQLVDASTAVPQGTIALHMIRDGQGRVVGLENAKGTVRLLGAAYASDKLAPWVVAGERAEFVSQVRAMGAVGERTHTGDTISRDSPRVTTGIETQRDRLPVSREVIAAREFALPTGIPGERLTLPPEHPEQWAARLEAYLTTALRGRAGRVRVTLVTTGRDGVHMFHVINGAEDLGTIRVYDSMDTAQLEAQLRAEVAAKVPTLEPESERGTAPIAGGTTAQLTSHAREPVPGLKRGATLAGIVDEWAAMPEGTDKQVEAKADVFANRVEAAVKRVAQTLAELHNQYADGALMSSAAKQRDIQAVHAQLASPEVVRVIGADQIAQIRARLQPLEAAFLAAKLPATAELGNASAGALEFKDYKLDPEETAKAQANKPNAKVMMFGRMSAADVGGIRASLDPATQKGTGTGAADVAQFLESLHQDPRLAEKAAELENLFGDIYRQTLVIKPAQADQVDAERWYRTAAEIGRAARGEPGAAERLHELSTPGATP